MPEGRPSPRRGNAGSPDLYTLALTTLVIAICYFAREVLLPFALAVLLSFLLAPLARRLERGGLGRIGSVIVCVAFSFTVLVSIGWTVTRQALDLATNLPRYEQTLIEKVRALRSTGSSALGRVARTVEHIEQELAEPEAGSGAKDGPTTGDAPTVAAGQAPPAPSLRPGDRETNIRADELRAAFSSGAQPLPVRVVDTTLLPLRVLRDISPLLAQLGSLAITVVFVIFMLLERDDLRDRLIRLAGTSRVYVTTQALDDAATRVSRYLMMQLIVNGCYGIAVGLGLFCIGLPNAFLWGLLATLLRFLPYVGPLIGSLTPIALSLAVFDGWTRPLLTIGLFVVLELITNNVLEPWLYGSSTGVSTLGIIVAAVFWTWLWGPVGLVLATPLTVCITVLSRHVPQFAFLNILLADEKPLELRVRFYQRLLAQDYDEAFDVAAEFLRRGSVDDLADGVLLPALALAETDRDAGRLDHRQEQFVYDSITDLIGDLDTRLADATPAEAAASNDDATLEEHVARPLRVLCLGDVDEADRVSALLLGKLLAARGHVAHVSDGTAAGDDALELIEDKRIECVVLSSVAPALGALHARRACLRLRRRFPDLKLLVGLWKAPGLLDRTRERLSKTGADAVAASLSEALEHIDEWASQEDSRTQTNSRRHTASKPARVPG